MHGNREKSQNGVAMITLRSCGDICARPERSGDGRDENCRLVMAILASQNDVLDGLRFLVSFKGCDVEVEHGTVGQLRRNSIRGGTLGAESGYGVLDSTPRPRGD